MTSERPNARIRRPRRRVGSVALVVVCLVAVSLGVVADSRPLQLSGVLRDKASADLPVDVTAQYRDDGIIGEAWWQTLPASVTASDMTAGSSCPYMRDRLREQGGVDRGWSEVTVTIRAKKSVDIVIQSARSRLVSSAPPSPERTLLCVPDPEPYMAREDLLNFDLGFLVDHDGYASNLPGVDPQANAIKLGFGEIQELDFKAYAHSCDCIWEIAFELLVDGKSHQWRLRDATTDRPFRTIAPPQSPGDSTNIVWCAPDGQGRLTLPERRDCPIPVVYETPLY